MTTRGLVESDFVKVADFLDRAVKLSLRIQSTSGKMLKEFTEAASADAEVAALKAEVSAFASAFPMPGKPVSA